MQQTGENTGNVTINQSYDYDNDGKGSGSLDDDGEIKVEKKEDDNSFYNNNRADTNQSEDYCINKNGIETGMTEEVSTQKMYTASIK